MSKQALDYRRLTAFSVDPDDLLLVDDKAHPLYDARVNMPLNEGLVRNVMVYGVIEPVIIRKDGEKIEVIDGRQRVKAAREANKRLKAEGKETLEVPCMLRRGEDAMLFGVSVSANENRADDSILAKAIKAGRLLDMGKDAEYISLVFGVTENTVRTWIGLLNLSAELKKAVEGGEVSPSAAAKLADLSREDQAKALAEMRATGNKTTKAAHTIKKGKAVPKKTRAIRTVDEIKERIEQMKERKAGLETDGWICALRWVLKEVED